MSLGWGIPILLVVGQICHNKVIGFENCFPEGSYIRYWNEIPIIVMLTINFEIFILIISKISTKDRILKNQSLASEYKWLFSETKLFWSNNCTQKNSAKVDSKRASDARLAFVANLSWKCGPWYKQDGADAKTCQSHSDAYSCDGNAESAFHPHPFTGSRGQNNWNPQLNRAESWSLFWHIRSVLILEVWEW